MELYFSPLACSMASRFALYEAGIEARFNQVDGRAKRTRDGKDFYGINPLGLVPVLRTDAGTLLTENQVVLQYIADRKPAAGLAADGEARYRLQQWLAFIATELHKAVFMPLLSSKSNDGARAFARDAAEARFEHLNKHLADREMMLDHFTVVDAYLTVVLNWAKFAGIELAKWPAVEAYFQRMLARPAIARAHAEEVALFKEEQAARKAS